MEVASTWRKLVDSMLERVELPDNKQEDPKTFGDNAARECDIRKLTNYFDGFYLKLKAKAELKGPDLYEFKRLLKACALYSEASVLFSEAIASYSLILKRLMDLLEMNKQSFEENNEYVQDVGEILLSAIKFLYFCSMSSNNKMFFKIMNAVGVIDWYAKDTRKLKTKEGKIISMCCMLILAHITDDTKKEDILPHEHIIDNILQNLDEALLDSSKLRSDLGFSARELVRALKTLANNDETSRVIFRKATVTRLMKLIKRGGPEEKLAAVECIWALAFANETIRLPSAGTTEIVSTLQQIRQSETGELQRAADGASWKIQVDKRQISTTTQNKHVMISYNWTNREKVFQIKEALESNGYRVWIDVDEMHRDIYQRMAEGVEQAAVVLVCMSQAYSDSQFCRLETEYAATLNKPIIPLKMQKGFNPSGWLGIIAAGRLYYQFTGEENFNEEVSNLMREIGDRGKENI